MSVLGNLVSFIELFMKSIFLLERNTTYADVLVRHNSPDKTIIANKSHEIW